jgi:hypothetical protein
MIHDLEVSTFQFFSGQPPHIFLKSLENFITYFKRGLIEPEKDKFEYPVSGKG